MLCSKNYFEVSHANFIWNNKLSPKSFLLFLNILLLLLLGLEIDAGVILPISIECGDGK